MSGMYVGGGINGVLALMLTSEEAGDTNQFQANMLTFNIMTIIGASIASLPWLLAFRFILSKFRGMATDEETIVFHSVSLIRHVFMQSIKTVFSGSGITFSTTFGSLFNSSRSAARGSIKLESGEHFARS